MRSTLVALIVVTGLLASACSGSDPDPDTGNSRGLAHIHGLGVNPADGVLYAGTHYGVYRLPGDQDPELVGGVVQDFMGFTVAGPNHFLGSGHPGQGDHDHPPNLGLIESTDGGQSWQSVSMNGEADFHSLEYRHGTVYGVDSTTQTVMVTADKRTWGRRASVRAVDIAVSPLNANEILATSAGGLLRSQDQARSFTSVGAAPPLVFLSWPDEGPLVGVDSGAAVYISDDAGVSWQPRRALEERPQALLAMSDGSVFVATDRGIHRSTDNGETFEEFVGFDTR